jgi:hypothetical protein
MNVTSTRDTAIPASQPTNRSENETSAYWLLTVVLVVYGAFAVAGSAGTNLLAGI